MLVKQYFLKKAQLAQQASNHMGFCEAARLRYSRIALRFRIKASRVID